MEQKNKLIPEFRFPEFMKDGEWKEKSIEKVLIESRIPSIENDVNKRITVRLNLKGIEKREVRGTESENATYFFQRKKGQFIYGKQNLHKGAFGLIPEELDGYESSQDIPSFDFNDGFSPEFFVQYLSQENIYTQLEKISTGTGSKRIHPKDFYKVKYPFPKNINEQQKIAYCLSSLDELITAHNDKLESLKNHKKGLLQNLFPQENQKIPNYRFPEFVNDGEWEVEKLESYIELFSGIALKSNEITDDKFGIPILRGINITEGYIRHSNDIDKFFLGEIDNIEKYFVKENDIVIGMDGSKVGKNVALIKKEDENSILIQRVARIRTIKNAETHFIYQYFISNKFRDYVDKVNTSSGIPHISAQQIKDFKVGIPPKIQEQQKIADCLTAVDNLITAQTEKIEQLKAHKKGLMQGLFPKLEN